MTIRITTHQNSRGGIVVVAGRLDADGVRELERVIVETPNVTGLDLDGLRAADETGLEALRNLRDRGIALKGASRYLALLLGEEPR